MPGEVASLPMRNWNSYGKRYALSMLLGCEPSYEELKQNIFEFAEEYRAIVASLPMRNWNPKTYQMPCQVLQSCEPSYEELKPYILPSFPVALGSVASLPMRNWNLYGFRGLNRKWEVVASLPMRNWNTDKKLSISLLSLCCEPSYEELKHTYRFLAYVYNILGCEPSYEELKPSINRIIKLNSNHVASLPMRNWNNPACVSSVILCGVASLPMRNWNENLNRE